MENGMEKGNRPYMKNHRRSSKEKEKEIDNNGEKKEKDRQGKCTSNIISPSRLVVPTNRNIGVVVQLKENWLASLRPTHHPPKSS